jgi:quercetin dioxygenase-like cupin family protein
LNCSTRSSVRVVSVPDHEQGGDPACWAHIFDEPPTESAAACQLVDLATVAGVGGAVWSLPHGGDLDVNLVRLAPGEAIGEHVNHDVDVLIVAREGAGELSVDGVVHALTESVVASVAKGASRSVRAGERGLAYLSVHRPRPALGIRSRD